MPDFNPDRELGQGIVKYAVRNAHPGIPIKSVKTGRGELKLDRLGRCLVADKALAAEIRKSYPLDLAVSRVFTNHPADRGHHYHFGQNPIAFDENGNRIREEDSEQTSEKEGENAIESS